MSTSSILYLNRRHIQLIRLLVGTVLTTKKLLLTVQEVGKYKMPKSSCQYQCAMKYYSELNCMKWNQFLWCDSSTNLGRNQNWAQWRPLKSDSVWCMQWGFEMPMRNREWQEQMWLSKGDLPAYLKKNEERIPWAALLKIRHMVAFECPSNILNPFPPAPAPASPSHIQKLHKAYEDIEAQVKSRIVGQ